MIPRKMVKKHLIKLGIDVSKIPEDCIKCLMTNHVTMTCWKNEPCREGCPPFQSCKHSMFCRLNKHSMENQ